MPSVAVRSNKVSREACAIRLGISATFQLLLKPNPHTLHNKCLEIVYFLLVRQYQKGAVLSVRVAGRLRRYVEQPVQYIRRYGLVPVIAYGAFAAQKHFNGLSAATALNRLKKGVISQSMQI